MTKVKITGSYGYAGTRFTQYYEVPDHVPTNEIEYWAESLAEATYDEMCERLSCGYEIIEE